MENSSNNILEQLISDYSAELLTSGTMTPSQISEVKDHLYMESSALLETNLNQFEAFTVAKMRFGSSEYISTEYSKIQPSNFILNTALYSLLGLFFIQALTFLCKLPVLIYVLLSDMPGTHSFRVGACIGMLMLVLPYTIMLIRKPKIQLALKSIMMKWYFPLFFAGLYILDRMIMFLMTGASALALPIDVWASLYYASSWLLIIFYAMITVYSMFAAKKRRSLEHV